MGKITWVASMILSVGLIGLVGCSEKTTKEAELEKKIAELEKRLDEEKKAQEEQEKKNREEEDQEKLKEEEPVLVNILDPTTQEIIHTFKPEELGFQKNEAEYRKLIKEWAKVIARGSDNQKGYDQRMVPDKIGIDGKIIKGSPRIILEETELLERVIDASIEGGTIELPLYVTESDYVEEEALQLDEVVIASYTTHFNPGVVGRSKNIELSAEAINNVIIGKGDIFSFNTTVGPSDAAHGYQKAPEVVNGKLVEGVGGGICQTSSTLFNAVDKLGVAYIEKHHHSLSVSYVPKGRDATVSYGGLDFRFQNTIGVPFILKAIIKDGSLTVEARTSKANQELIKKPS